ncbi:barstar family protein [Streptomyces sp. HUAS TT3]|uniref:barstar family protein n=1 Tax=Streptomyces sp. HUAS TT3 TaxID=3447510 RepID=UPI003F655ECC
MERFPMRDGTGRKTGLAEVLARVPDNTWTWLLLDWDGVGEAPGALDLEAFRDLVPAAPTGIPMTWPEVQEFAAAQQDVVYVLLVAVDAAADADPQRFAQDDFAGCRYLVEGFDSGTWTVGRPDGRPAPFDLSGPVSPWVVFGPRDAPAFAEQSGAFRARGGRVHHLRAEDLREMVSACDAFAREIGFPGYFGRNWDALVDCLDDLHPHQTGGVGILCFVHGADVLLDCPELKTLVSVLCLAADRANTPFDPDGDPTGNPVVVEHFVFLLDEVDAVAFAPLVEEPDDVVAAVDGEFATAALDLAAWRPVTWARGLHRPV